MCLTVLTFTKSHANNIVLLVLELYINGIIFCLVFWDLIIPLIMFLRFIHAQLCVAVVHSFPLMSILWGEYIIIDLSILCLRDICVVFNNVYCYKDSPGAHIRDKMKKRTGCLKYFNS